MASTAALLALALGNVPTQAPIPAHDYKRHSDEASLIVWLSGTTQGNSAVTAAATRADPTSDVWRALRSYRQTTPAEHVIGELRRWALLAPNWDGEGASAPSVESIREASAFAGLLSDGSVVEPMLHASGRAGLYFRTATLYADIEFLGDGRAAYYVEHAGDKHKGVVNFDSKQMPAVFSALLQT
jgi:hypothetical protein